MNKNLKIVLEGIGIMFILRKIADFCYRVLELIRIFVSSEVPSKFIFRKDIKFGHAVGIVIGQNVKIGKNVMIYSNVTIGGKSNVCSKRDYPIIEDNVVIYTGAKIIGRVIVGKGAIVGAGAVVIKDVPKNAIVIGNPARILKKIKSKQSRKF